MRKAAELTYLCDSKVILLFSDPDDVIYRFFSGDHLELMKFFQI